MPSRKRKSDDVVRLDEVRVCQVKSRDISTENLVVSRSLVSPRLDDIEAAAQEKIAELSIDLQKLKARLQILELKTQYQISDAKKVVVTGAPIIVR
jgi:hypothetical protein